VAHGTDAWWDMKTHGYRRPTDGFNDIHMPANTGTGIIMAGFFAAMGFALVWHIWWLAIAGFVCGIGTGIAHTFDYDHRAFTIGAGKVARVENARTRLLGRAGKGA
jgi:cytochrome o ubiquinol oxidase subunit 1